MGSHGQTMMIQAAFYLPYFLVAVIFCVDMCIGTLQFFQQYANVPTRLTQFFSEAAYAILSDPSIGHYGAD
jgi:hypothetical protein